MEIQKSYKGRTAASLVAAAKITQAQNGEFHVCADLPEQGTCRLEIETNKVYLSSKGLPLIVLSGRKAVCALTMSGRTFDRYFEMRDSARNRTWEWKAGNPVIFDPNADD